jgi:hypothetical protein
LRVHIELDLQLEEIYVLGGSPRELDEYVHNRHRQFEFFEEASGFLQALSCTSFGVGRWGR